MDGFRSKTIRCAAVIALCCVGAQAALAETMRCGSHIIKEGMKQQDVEKYCGRPNSTYMGQWIYSRGSAQFDIVIHFNAAGEVSRILEEVGEGYNRGQ